MFCPRCSNECEDNLLFCPKCGYKLNTFSKKESKINDSKEDFFDEMILSPQEEKEVETYISKDFSGELFKTDKTKTDFFDEDDDFEDDYIPPILNRNKEKNQPLKTSLSNASVKSKSQVKANRDSNHAKKVLSKQSNQKDKKKRLIIVIIIAIFSVLLAVLGTFFIKKASLTKKYNKYFNQGNFYYTQQNYKEAKTQFINAANYAYTKEQKIKSYEMIYQLDALLGGYVDEEIKYLELLIDVVPDNIEYYKSLIVLYQNNGMESKVDRLINLAPNFVKESLEGFDGTIPVASVEAGTYDKPIEVQLTSMEGLTIYYTISEAGSGEVTEELEYTDSILFDKEGSFTLTAYSTDDKGKNSKELVVKYIIDMNMVEPPVVSLKSGAYSSSKKVKVTAEEGCTIYYTTTGVTPTKDSKVYRKAISLPKGDSIYYFVAINADGVASDVVTRAYSVSPEYDIDYDTALGMLSLALVSDGTLENKYGEFENGDVAYFEYTGIEVIDKTDYYIISCEIESREGSTISTKIYAVSCETGDCFSAKADGTGYSLSGL